MSEPSPIGGDFAGYVHEIFSGIQGEGLLVGERQIFVRLGGCNLSCAYCDTETARIPGETCRVEQTAGARDFLTRRNPIYPEDVAACVERLEASPKLHHSVALTGGEPLVQAGFVACIASRLQEKGFRIMLETNGALPEALEQAIRYVDIVSMDVKLSGTTGGPDLLEQHELFLQKARSAEVFVKVVLSSDTCTSELIEAVRMVASVDSDTPLILQPVSPVPGDNPPSPAQVLEWQAQCRLHLCQVRVIPQCHKMIGQL